MELELDVACGRVVALIVCGEGLSSFFLGKGNTVVPWERISRIGKDTILVELPAELQEKCSSGDVKCKEKRWWHF